MVIVALAVVAVALMVTFQVRQVRRVGRERRAAVAPVAGLLSEAVVTQDGIGYPTVTGRRHGREVKVALVVDTLTVRQLPRLWLTVSVQRRLPIEAPLDVVLRPLSTDIVSPGQRFAYEHPVPVGWPEHIRIASPQPMRLPPLDELDELARLLHDPHTKNVLLAPGGVRIVHELARGDVASYRVVRRPSFRFALEDARVRDLLDTADAVGDALERLAARTEVAV